MKFGIRNNMKSPTLLIAACVTQVKSALVNETPNRNITMVDIVVRYRGRWVRVLEKGRGR